MRPKLLDLFCGAGGCSVGYHRAGFDCVGVDIVPRPNYPFPVVQGDALRPPVNLDAFDVIHASPPCQAYTWAAGKARNAGSSYPDLVSATREMLSGSGKPYVIENTNGAPLHHAIRLCGIMFGLGVLRHRYFECHPFIFEPEHPSHEPPVMVAARDGTDRMVKRSRYCSVAGHGGESRSFAVADWEEAMGIDWMSRKELTQAIPPAFTEYIGKRIMETIR